jgi:hypothetical protein
MCKYYKCSKCYKIYAVKICLSIQIFYAEDSDQDLYQKSQLYCNVKEDKFNILKCKRCPKNCKVNSLKRYISKK